MLRRNALIFLSSLAALGISPAVQAQVAGQASLTGLRYTLIDLAPDDGITPSLTWGESRNYLYFSQQVQDQVSVYGGGFPSYTVVAGDYITSTGPWGEAMHTGHDGYEMRMDAQGLSGVFHGPLGDQVVGSGQHRAYFTLTPSTAVTFWAQIGLDIDAELPAGAPYPHADGGQPYIQGGVGGYLYANLKGDATVRSNLGLPFKLDEAGPALLTRSENELMLVTLNNIGTQSRAGEMSAEFSFWTRTVRAPVPEPATWLQMLGGLAGLGALVSARRRRGATRPCSMRGLQDNKINPGVR